MTKIAELSSADLKAQLEGVGINLQTGPFVIRLRTNLDALSVPLRFLYSDFTVDEEAQFADFHIRIAKPRNLRAWLRPQVLFQFQGRTLFNPYPLKLAFPLFEWGMNWCIATYAHQYLVIHSAVLERDGQALLLTAPPGSGKSTLAAALTHRGWRLLSDELALIRPADTHLIPLPRPIGLKNESIQAIRSFIPEAVIGQIWPDTRKGTVAHVRPPRSCVELAGEIPLPAWIVFLSYRANSGVQLKPFPKSRAFLRVCESAFNYSLLGRVGFKTMASLIDLCDCYEFSYGNLEEAVKNMSELRPVSHAIQR